MSYCHDVIILHKVDNSLGGYHVPMFQPRSPRFLSPGLASFSPDPRQPKTVAALQALTDLKRSADPGMPSGRFQYMYITVTSSIYNLIFTLLYTLFLYTNNNEKTYTQSTEG